MVLTDPCRNVGARAADLPCPETSKPFVLWVAIFGSSLAFIDGTVVTIAVPEIRAAFNATLSDMQWVVNSYAVVLAALLLIGGAAGDLIGQRQVFNAGIAVFALASLGCGVAQSVDQLIVARAVQGLGGAMMVPASLALITRNFPPDERGRAIGTWAAASGIAAAIGPILGGLLVDAGSWRAIFLINLPFAAVAVGLSLWRVPSRGGIGGAIDWPGALLALISLGALAWGLTSLGEADGPIGLVLIALGVGTVLLIGFVVFEARAAAPMMPLDLFGLRVFSSGNILTLLLYFALTGSLFFAPMTLIEARGYSAAEAGAMFLPFTAVMAGLSGWAGRLSDRVGPRPLLTTGPIIAGVGFALLIPAVQSGEFWFGVLPAMVVLGIGMGLTVAPLSAAIMGVVPEDRAGVASGVNNAVSRVAGLLAVAALGGLAAIAFDEFFGAAVAGAGLEEVAAPLVGSLQFGERIVSEIVSGDTLDRIRAARGAAMVDTFAVLSGVSAVLAVLSGLVAFTFMRPAATGPSPS